MRVQIGMAGARAGNGEGEAEQLGALKGADDLPTDLPADDEHAQRNQIDISKIPDLFLERNASLKLFQAVALADGDPVNCGDGGVHAGRSSRLLAFCHKVSISSSVASSSVRPCWRNCSSIQPKRRRNFLLVRRNADSESTER